MSPDGPAPDACGAIDVVPLPMSASLFLCSILALFASRSRASSTTSLSMRTSSTCPPFFNRSSLILAFLATLCSSAFSSCLAKYVTILVSAFWTFSASTKDSNRFRHAAECAWRAFPLDIDKHPGHPAE